MTGRRRFIDGRAGHVKVIDATIKPLQELEAIVSPAGRMRQERKVAQLRRPAPGTTGNARGPSAD
jgi:hypothetical protein